MIVDLDYGTTDPRRQQLFDDGAAFDGTGFTVRLELMQIGGLVWHAATAYVTGDLIRPPVGNGRLYRATVDGTSNSVEPTWPTTPGGLVTDGSVQWEEFTPQAAWDVQASGIVVLTGLEELPAETSYRARYLVTDGGGNTAPFPNKGRIDTWRVGAPMAG